MPEIVEPRDREYEADPRRPNLHPSQSSPSAIKLPSEQPRNPQQRSATLEVRPSKEKAGSSGGGGSLRHSATTPLEHMVSPTTPSHAPAKSSRLRTSARVHDPQSDSGSETPSTSPEVKPANVRRHVYPREPQPQPKGPYFSDHTDDDVKRSSAPRSAGLSNGPQTPNIVRVEPSAAADRDRDRGSHRTHLRDRDRDASPRGHRPSPVSPHATSASSVRSPGPSPHAAAYAAVTSPPPSARPSMKTHASSASRGGGRDGERLFAEVNWKPERSSGDSRGYGASSVRRGSAEESRRGGERERQRERDYRGGFEKRGGGSGRKGRDFSGDRKFVDVRG